MDDDIINRIEGPECLLDTEAAAGGGRGGADDEKTMSSVAAPANERLAVVGKDVEKEKKQQQQQQHSISGSSSSTAAAAAVILTEGEASSSPPPPPIVATTTRRSQFSSWMLRSFGLSRTTAENTRIGASGQRSQGPQQQHAVHPFIIRTMRILAFVCILWTTVLLLDIINLVRVFSGQSPLAPLLLIRYCLMRYVDYIYYIYI